MPKCKADTLSGLERFRFGLGGDESLVLVDSVKPLRVRLWAHDEHGIVGEWDALRGAWGRFRVAIERHGFSGNVTVTVFLHSQRHRALSTEADIDNIGSTDDIDGFVGVLRYVVRPRAIELD